MIRYAALGVAAGDAVLTVAWVFLWLVVVPLAVAAATAALYSVVHRGER